MGSPISEKGPVTPYETRDADSSDGHGTDTGSGKAVHTISNPLVNLSREQLFAGVDDFAAEKNLNEHVELLRRGAQVAQNPAAFLEIADLKQDEKDALEHEVNHKWSQTLTLYVTIFLCSVGAATQGWDQTGSNGANLSFPLEFGLDTTTGAPGADRANWIVGLVNAAPYIASAFIGCWLSDPLNSLLGRRGCIFVTALILIATPIASGFTHSWETLFVVRLILGIGMGAKGATVPIFAAENAPATIRGALVMGWQLWTAFGIFLGTVANVVVLGAGSITWRLQLGSAFIPAVPLAIGIFFCPESPRWLMKKNRYAEAFKSLRRLRKHEIQAARDLYYIHVLLMEENKIPKGETYFKRAMELFTIPRVRRATVASGTVMLAQQMCGINIIAFYSSTIFQASGFSAKQAIYASMGFGAVNFVFAFPALLTIDTFGRRSLLLFTFPNMAWSLLLAGLLLLVPGQQARLGCVATFVYVFAAFYSPGEGPVPFTYSAEVFPLAQREQGMAWAVATCLFWAAVLSISLPRMLEAFTPTGVFGFYAGLNLIALVLIFLFVPETKQLTLEELDEVFSIPHSEFIHHQTTKVVPAWWKRTILRRKDVPKPEPLYKASAHSLGGARKIVKDGQMREL